MYMDTKLFCATKAFIIHKGKVLLLRESNTYQDGTKAGLFDVVGGRVTPGEKFDQSLLREVKEETGLAVKIGKPFFVNESWPVVRGEQWQIIRIFFECIADSDTVQLSEDHDTFIWIDPRKYKKVKLIDNLLPVFESYLKKDGRQ